MVWMGGCGCGVDGWVLHTSESSAVCTFMVTVCAVIITPVTSFVPYRATALISETDVNGTFVLQAEAMDDDQMGTPNADIRFSLLGDVPFGIDAVSGNITVNGTLSARQYNITVIATDLGVPARMGMGYFLIDVAPANEHAPQFVAAPYTVNVLENTVPVDPVLTFTVSDSSTGDEALVEILDLEGPDADSFYLNVVYMQSNGSVGELFLNGTLDREEQDILVVTLIARDSGIELFQLTSSTNVTLTVDDVNDNTPYFTSQLDPVVLVSENASVGQSVFLFAAMDDDIGTNAKLSFTVEGSSDFVLDEESGNLTVAITLTKSRQENYTLLVTVSDSGGRNTSTNITIFVTEVNDNPPMFVPPLPSTMLVKENSFVPLQLVNVSANDPDTGNSGLFDLTLLEDGTFFELNDSILTLISPLDYEDRAEHQLSVIATDRGFPPLSVVANITVVVDDVNEFAPVFSMGVYTRETVFTTAINSELLTVVATDRDGRDTSITYGLGSDAPTFVAINPRTGVVRTSNLLPENRAMYNFTVTATDNGMPSVLNSTAQVRLNVFSPVNEFEPQFDKALYNATVPENSPVGTPVVTVTITDNDGPGPAGFIRSVVLGGSDSHLFNISAPTIIGNNNTVEAVISTRLVLYTMYSSLFNICKWGGHCIS